MLFNCAEVQLKMNWSISDRAKVELMKYILNILLFEDQTILINSDIKTHFRLNIKKCALNFYISMSWAIC